jgi:hypothetical protein
MRAYADSSFIGKLISLDPDAEEFLAEFRAANRPKLFFLPLHEIEVTNAIFHRAFHKKLSLGPSHRKTIFLERDAALSKFNFLIRRGILAAVTLDSELAHKTALDLARKHTERLGARAIDLLHVANALTLKTELFFTADERQAELARAAGLEVI